MSNEFDLERAKAGEPVDYGSDAGGWVSAHFVGMSKLGYPVIEKDVYGVQTAAVANLRMAPKTVKVRYRDYVRRGFGGEMLVHTMNNVEDWLTSREIEGYAGFVKWIHTEWQEAEIPQ